MIHIIITGKRLKIVQFTLIFKNTSFTKNFIENFFQFHLHVFLNKPPLPHITFDVLKLIYVFLQFYYSLFFYNILLTWYPLKNFFTIKDFCFQNFIFNHILFFNTFTEHTSKKPFSSSMTHWTIFLRYTT